MGYGPIFLKISTPLPLHKTFRMSSLLARFVSLDSTFETACTLGNAVPSDWRFHMDELFPSHISGVVHYTSFLGKKTYLVQGPGTPCWWRGHPGRIPESCIWRIAWGSPPVGCSHPSAGLRWNSVKMKGRFQMSPLLDVQFNFLDMCSA